MPWCTGKRCWLVPWHRPRSVSAMGHLRGAAPRRREGPRLPEAWGHRARRTNPCASCRSIRLVEALIHHEHEGQPVVWHGRRAGTLGLQLRCGRLRQLHSRGTGPSSYGYPSDTAQLVIGSRCRTTRHPQRCEVQYSSYLWSRSTVRRSRPMRLACLLATRGARCSLPARARAGTEPRQARLGAVEARLQQPPAYGSLLGSDIRSCGRRASICLPAFGLVQVPEP